MALVEVERQEFPTAHVVQAKCTFRQVGYIP
jgi:hypothetical protein